MENARQVQYIEVSVGEVRYALNISDIHEIIKMQHITEIPSSKAYIKGVINLRGKLVSIISLRNRFGMLEEAYTKKTRIVVVNYANEMIGIVVDHVNQVTTFQNVQRPPDRIDHIRGSYLSGIGETETGLVCILSLDQILR